MKIAEKIAQYRILKKIGEGGMGQVFLAEDTKLERKVALKFLPAHLALEKNAKQRLLVEAKTAAALDHPNICTIFEIGEEEEHQYISMAFVEGVTLRDKIKNGVLLVEEAVDIARQIAEGLKAAHEKGIIHRDIKSDNIMITDKGQVKIMDFGLSRLTSRSHISTDATTLGTVVYMSPEQVQGEEVDFRSDIWSFGVVLYEMLTGQLPFKGEFDQAIMYSIVNEKPKPVQNYLPDIPEMLILILDNLLKRERADRYQAIREVLVDLESFREDSKSDFKMSKKLTPGKKIRKSRPTKKSKVNIGYLYLTVVLGILLIVTTLFFLLNSSFKKPIPSYKITPFTTLPGIEVNPAFSPDGNQIAYSWNGGEGDNYNIYVKIIGTNTHDRITNHLGRNYSPTWSPDGRFIAFIRRLEGKSSLYIIPARGGVETPVRQFDGGWAKTFPLPSLAWSNVSQSILLSARNSNQGQYSIFSIHPEDNTTDTLRIAPDLQGGDYLPAVSPDGKWVGYTRWYADGVSEIFVQPIPQSEPIRLTNDEKAVKCLSWTTDSKEIVFISNRTGNFNFWKISSTGGSPKLLPMNAQQVLSFAISPKENSMAVVEQAIDLDVWRLNIAENRSEKFIFSTRNDSQGIFSPDGEKILYLSRRTGENTVWICDKNGQNERQLPHSFGSSPSWSPDGNYIAVDATVDKSKQIFVLDVAGGPPKRVTWDNTTPSVPRWSRDGRWIYFRSSRSGKAQIWKKPVKGGEAIQVTQNGGRIAMESSDGKWLYFSKRDTYGIWRISTTGGEEELVMDIQFGWRNWVVQKKGIYFIRDTEIGFNIEYFDFKSGTVQELLTEEGEHGIYLSVSPDEKYVLYTKRHQKEADIYLVENF